MIKQMIIMVDPEGSWKRRFGRGSMIVSLKDCGEGEKIFFWTKGSYYLGCLWRLRHNSGPVSFSFFSFIVTNKGPKKRKTNNHMEVSPDFNLFATLLQLTTGGGEGSS